MYVVVTQTITISLKKLCPLIILEHQYIISKESSIMIWKKSESEANVFYYCCITEEI